jgi:hypothetical protein
MSAPTFYDVLVVGMHFRESEGVPAKSIVQNMVPPLALDLEREPNNPHDSFALKALYQDQHIGYIEAKVACFISPWIDSGEEYVCVVNQLVEQKRNLHPLCTLMPKPAYELENKGENAEPA